jgi:hypothetical protein
VPPVRAVFRVLASIHVERAHGVTAAEYWVLAGLRPRHPPKAPAVRARHAAVMRDQIETDERVAAVLELLSVTVWSSESSRPGSRPTGAAASYPGGVARVLGAPAGDGAAAA